MRDKIGHDLLCLQSVAVLLFDDQCRLLLAQGKGSPLWMTVGGAVEPDETPANAAVRECLEETGLRAGITDIIGVFGGPDFRVTYPNGDAVSYVITAFKARLLEGDLRPDGGETAALRFFTEKEAMVLPMSALTKELVRHGYAYDGTPYFTPPD